MLLYFGCNRFVSVEIKFFDRVGDSPNFNRNWPNSFGGKHYSLRNGRDLPVMPSFYDLCPKKSEILRLNLI